MRILDKIQNLRNNYLKDINTFKTHKRIGAWFFAGLAFFCLFIAIWFGIFRLNLIISSMFLFVTVMIFLVYADAMHIIQYHMFDEFIKARKEAGLLDERNRDVEPANYVESDEKESA